MKIIEGNILNIENGMICHQVNCQGVMGAGLALQIKNKWPQAYKDYRKAFDEGMLFLGNTITSRVSATLYVAHMCGQDRYGRKPGKVYTDYVALAVCLGLLNFVEAGIPVYIPYGLGCGWAGGDWELVSQMIEDTLPDATIIKLK